MRAEAKSEPQSRRVKPWMYIAVLLVNVLVFTCIAAVYFEYSQDYNEKLFRENIKNVENLNAASANAAFTYTNSMALKIEDVISYIRLNKLSVEEAVQFLEETNTSPDRQLQLVLSGSYGETGELSFGDYSGVSVRKMKREGGALETLKRDIVYGSGYYDILRCFTDVKDENLHGLCFAPEFTDPDTKKKCFAVYRHADLTDEGGNRKLYTVLLAINSQTALNAYNMQNKYAGQSTVLVNENGDYIIKNSDYRNVNFYDYIVNYNGLTLDLKRQINEEVLQAAKGGSATANLFYKNHKGDDCVFSVAAMENGWYSITCVPLSSFNLTDDRINYSQIILLLFLALFAIDGVAIYLISKIVGYNVALAEKATEEANRANQAKSRFLSSMSHELRTPLNAIIGLVALSGDSVGDPPVLRDYLKKIDISSKLLLQLISDILDVSAIESNKMKLNTGEFDITKLITSLSAIYYDQCAAKGVEFAVVLKNLHSEKLVGDSVRLNQVLLNFLSNAVKFTPSGGKITLKAEQIEQDENNVRIRFDIIDTGCGVSDEMMPRLFKPFERAAGDAARKYSGTGLGLSIAKNLIEMMHGTVGVESREGKGSCFYTEIPFSIADKTERNSYSPIMNMYVLAVIHDSDEREYIGQILANFGVTHSLADSAETALSLLYEKREEGNAFDLCILDWKLYDLNALDAVKRIREEYKDNLLRIMILAYDYAETRQKCLDAGADLAFGKPVFPSALYNVLEELTTGQARLVPDTAKEYDLRGKRVLLVEDNKMNTEIAQLLLKKVGLSVETAEDGRAGFVRFTGSPNGYFDAILMDVQMPIMNGYEATAAIRASKHPQAKTIPILAMTADAFFEDVERARAAGMNTHLAKPIEPDTLYKTLKEYLFENKKTR